MARNPYFNNFNSPGQQRLIDNLVIESIKIFGHDIFYIPRSLMNKDDIYGEDTVSEYNNHYEIPMYIKSFDNYQGDGQFLSKFMPEIRDQMVFSIAQRTFAEDVAIPEGIDRPQEGDLIYSKMLKRLFIVMYVDNKALFYQMGSLQLYDLTCEVFEYSNEKINTGIAEIDNIEAKYSFDEEEQGLLTNDDYELVDNKGFGFIISQWDYDDQLLDVFADNEEFMDEAEDFVDWDERDPFSTGSSC